MPQAAAAQHSASTTSPMPLSNLLSSAGAGADLDLLPDNRGDQVFLMLITASCENQTTRTAQRESDGGFTFEVKFTLARAAVTTFVVAMLIAFTVFGNSLVLLSIAIDRRLQTISNYLIFSLAISDLLVALVVMPIALVNEISKHWFLGSAICDVWICSDVLCCTSSILHLVAIALDRYWSVTNLNYAHVRSKRRVLGMICIIWLISASISIPPLLGWREEGNEPTQTGVCRISQDPGYTIYSTLGAFYVPLVIMIVMYVRIYIAARRRIRNAGLRRRKAVVNSQIMLVLTEPSITIAGGRVTPAPRDLGLYAIAPQQESKAECEPEASGSDCANSSSSSPSKRKGTWDPTSVTGLSAAATAAARRRKTSALATTGSRSPLQDLQLAVRRKRSRGSFSSTHSQASTNSSFQLEACDQPRRFDKVRHEHKRQSRAIRTVLVITCVFVLCWTAFFSYALLAPLCKSCHFPPELVSVFVWLGYSNSFCNFVIYSICSPEFRRAFRNLFCSPVQTNQESYVRRTLL